MFTPEQTASLQAKLDPAHVFVREQGRSKLSYIESWRAISEANRIFGFDGWSSHTVELKCVAERERKIGKPPYEREGWGVSYIAKVLVSVGGVEREGSGCGHGIDADLGIAHESALKEAESDARKRAFMTFGNPFGLALYDKTQANVGRNEIEPDQAAPRQSSAALKRDDAWNKLMFKLSADFGDCKSLVTLSKLRADYREMARNDGWPKAWLDALANEFDTFEQSLQQTDQALTGDAAVKANSYASHMRAG